MIVDHPAEIAAVISGERATTDIDSAIIYVIYSTAIAMLIIREISLSNVGGTSVVFEGTVGNGEAGEIEGNARATHFYHIGIDRCARVTCLPLP